ncbi:MAG: S8 family peptidase [Bacteroidia bacterium]|nr:S8 family peptidase [Bacteroidia bacterium]
MKRSILLFPAALMFSALTFAGGNTLPKPTKRYFAMSPYVTAEDYMAKTVIIKVKPEFKQNCQPNAIINFSSLDFTFQNIGASDLQKMFPMVKSPDREYNNMGLKLVDLTTVYTLKYTSGQSVEEMVNMLYSLGMFEFVQPYYIPKTTFTPNDPQYQSAIFGTTRMDAVTGWNTQQGNTNVVIGITDTGTDLNHQDLTNQIKYNTADPINGSDDDGDGYVDNYRGWDVGMNDNDPTWQANNHGVHVSGCAAAQTNNSVGVSSTGFNCKFLPVKIADASGALVAAYQGITYAADHGCAIINCSWGGTGGGPMEQLVIDYVTINKDALVVAAAGNNNLDQMFYPSSLNYVISVAATNNSSDVKASFSNYNYSVDVSAPGNNITSTLPGNTYGGMSGTSMASPVAAGACGIIQSQFMSYNALQVGEHLKATTDNIYSIPANGSYINKLGTGRIDLGNAMTMSNLKSVLYLSQVLTDNNDDIFITNDTVRLTGTFTNMLSSVSSATTATLATTSSDVQILDASYPIGALATLGTNPNSGDPFEIKILPSCPTNAIVPFTLTISDAPWSTVIYFNLTLNVDYINITVNDIKTTITSRGRIGYNADGQQQGLGFQYLDSNLMYESSMMLGSSNTKVSDMFRGGASMDVDNATLLRVYQVVPSQVSAFDVDGRFNDAVAPSPIGIQTHHKGWAWTTPGNTKYVIVEYVLKNTNSTAVSNLYCGIITDWDVMNYSLNKANQNTSLRLGYVYSTQTNGLYAGTKLLTTTAPFVHYAVDNIAGGGGGIDPTAGTPAFDTGEKYTVLSTQRAQAGTTGNGNDVMDCVSSGPFSIAPGDSVVVAFALLAGDNLTDLSNSASNAQVTYDGILTGSHLLALQNQLSVGAFPNPAGQELYLNVNIPENSQATLKMFNVIGQEVMVVADENLASGKHLFKVDTRNIPNGTYFIELTAGGEKVVQKVVISK